VSKIFEDKHHNDPQYIGQKPVRPVMALPEDDEGDAKRGLVNWNIMTPMHVRNIPNKD
jgi:hypothetical protein